MAHDDSLAGFRRERWHKKDMASKQEPLTGHQVLWLAMNALNEIPHSGRSMEGYRNPSALLPEREKVYTSDVKEDRIREAMPEWLEAVNALREMCDTLEDTATQESRDGFAWYELCDTALAKTLPEHITAGQERSKLLEAARPEPEPSKDIEPERDPMEQDDDVLLEFSEGSIEQIGRSSVRHIDTAVFNRIGRSATSDQMAGDPYHYDACGISASPLFQLELRRVLKPWHAPTYHSMLDTVSDGKYGTELILIYTTLIITITGRHLQPIKQVIYARTCEYLQEYHQREFTPPAKHEPVIMSIAIHKRNEEEGRNVAEKKKHWEESAAGREDS